MVPISNSLFIFIQTTENDIGDAGVTSLSDYLKVNASLTELNLSCDHTKE